MRALMLEEQSQRNRDGTAELAEFLKSCIDTSINFDGSGIPKMGLMSELTISTMEDSRLTLFPSCHLLGFSTKDYMNKLEASLPRHWCRWLLG